MKVQRLRNNKFKTNEIAVFLSLPLLKDTITMNALIPAVLRRGTSKYNSQIEIGKQLENMYGAFFNCGVDKTGDNCILKFYIETICDKYAENGDNLIQQAMDLITELIFNPLVIEGAFNKQYIDQEKENLQKIIESKKDNKSTYSLNRCVEEMFKGKAYGIDKYGYLEDIEKIDEKNLYEYYKQMIESADINILINGEDAEKVEIPNHINNKGNLEITNTQADIRKEPQIIKEKADVTQGKLIIGMNVPSDNKFAVSLYNAVLGGGANSKLFQNVREKASLAYSAGSKYVRRKDAIFIVTGIELQNYDKALKIIEQQVQDMKDGNITDDEFDKAKQLILASLNMIKESQEDIITFNFDQSLFNENLSADQYIENISRITKEQVIEVAKGVSMNTIYYLQK